MPPSAPRLRSVPLKEKNPYTDEELSESRFPLLPRGEMLSPDDVEDIDEELDAKDLRETTRTEVGREAALRQAEEIAKEFPGLILDRNERAIRGNAAMRRASTLDEEVYGLTKTKEKIFSARTKVGIGTERSRSERQNTQGALTGLDEDSRQASGELRRATDEMSLYHAFPDVESEIEHRIDEFEEKRDRTTNELTRKGIDAKIRRLQLLQVLLEKVQSYEHPEDKPAREATEKMQREHMEGMTRVREHAAKRSAEKPTTHIERAPSPSHLEPTPEELTRWRNERIENERNVERGHKLSLFREQLVEQRTKLEVFAEELKERGQEVDLPWVSKSKQNKPPKPEPITSRFFKGVRNLFRAGETAQLLKKYEEESKAYKTTQQVLQHIENF